MTPRAITPTLTHINTTLLCHFKQIQHMRLWRVPFRGLEDILCFSVCSMYIEYEYIFMMLSWSDHPSASLAEVHYYLNEFITVENAAWPTWTHSQDLIHLICLIHNWCIGLTTVSESYMFMNILYLAHTLWNCTMFQSVTLRITCHHLDTTVVSLSNNNNNNVKL